MYPRCTHTHTHLWQRKIPYFLAPNLSRDDTLQTVTGVAKTHLRKPHFVFSHYTLHITHRHIITGKHLLFLAPNRLKGQTQKGLLESLNTPTHTFTVLPTLHTHIHIHIHIFQREIPSFLAPNLFEMTLSKRRYWSR